MTQFVISSTIDLLDRLLYEKTITLNCRGLDRESRISTVEKAAVLKGSEENLQGLKGDLKLMVGFLRRFSGSRNRHHLISQVRDMAIDVGVLMDNFIFIKSDELESVRLNNFLKEIESFRSRFREVNIQAPVEKTEDVGPQHRKAALRSDEEKEKEEVVVGLEKHVENIIQNFVLSEEERGITFAITGMGGIGKTTLARQIYNHADVVKQFHCRAWLFISGEFDVEEVVRAVMPQVVDLTDEEEEAMKKMDAESLRQMLHRHMQGKRYFIVLDNVSDDTNFSCIFYALPTEGRNLSKFLITRRSSYEAGLRDNYPPRNLKMDYLSYDVSWQLFLKMVFIGDNKCPKHLEEIGKQIVKKCNGLPIAIKEAGRKLATMIQSKSEWEEFLESFDFSKTIATLELSYHELFWVEKSCFLHMSFFKEGTTIRIRKLAHIWDAARIVTRLDIQSEDDAKKHIDELSRKCMIMVVGDGKFKNFCIDTFLHKICIAKAQEEIGLEILRNGKDCPTPLKPRHRAIYCTRGKLKNYSVNQDKHLLSLFFHGGGSFDLSPSYWESFEQLRILDFEGFGLKSLPEKVCALSRLRYLGLRDNYIQELPHTLGLLKNLEVLDITHNFMIEVPDMIWEMDRLRHLYMSNIICRTPLKIDLLKYLQTLTYISINNWTYELFNLEKMVCLRKLGIEEVDENSDVSKLFASLSKLKNLECLILRGCRFKSMPPLDDLSNLHGLTTLKLDGRLTRLPKFPPFIRSVTLVNSCLDEDPMPELLKSSNLSSLVLKNAYTGQEMVISFRGLRFDLSMCIFELWHLRNLKLSYGLINFPKLLDICSCPYLDNIPKDIIRIRSPRNLEQLRMQTTRKIAKLIRQSLRTSKIRMDIQPY